MSIYTGSTEIQGIYAGSTEVQSVYSGSDLVWQNKILTALFSGISANESGSGVWGAGASDKNNAIDGDYGTYAEYSGTDVGQVTTGSLEITFAGISASEILRMRIRAKGRGGDHTYSLKVAGLPTATASSPSEGDEFLVFAAGGTFDSAGTAGPINTVDSGLQNSQYTDVVSGDYSFDLDFGLYCGTSSAVLDWWSEGAKFRCTTRDFNGGGIGGRIYELQLQVEYKPA